MENLFIHLGHYPRRLKAVPTVQTIGHFAAKKEFIHRTFNTCNFSFILDGTGVYRLHGKDYPVETPCVLTQWPGEPMNYGPRTTWREIYMIYSGKTEKVMRDAGVLSSERVIWPVDNIDEVSSLLEELWIILEDENTPDWSDRVDMLCWRIVTESLISPLKPHSMSDNERIVRELAEVFRKSPEREYDFDEIATAHGMSLSTFRRCWMKYIKIPPARFIADLKVEMACKMLVSTSLPISQIAEDINFKDPLYFSRFFRERTGVPATEYRKLNRLDSLKGA